MMDLKPRSLHISSSVLRLAAITLLTASAVVGQRVYPSNSNNSNNSNSNKNKNENTSKAPTTNRPANAEVYVERDDQRWSGYGGMERCELLADRIRLTLDDRGAAAMEGIRLMEVSFDLTSHQLDVLRDGLRQCFSGFHYYVDGAA